MGECPFRTDGNTVPATVSGPLQGKVPCIRKLREFFGTDGNVRFFSRNGRAGDVAPGNSEGKKAESSSHFPDETVLARSGGSHDINDSSAHDVFALEGAAQRRREGKP